MSNIVTNLIVRMNFRIRTLTPSLRYKIRFAEDCNNKEHLSSWMIKRAVVDRALAQILKSAGYVSMARGAREISILEVFISEEKGTIYGCKLGFIKKNKAGELKLFTFSNDPVMLKRVNADQ